MRIVVADTLYNDMIHDHYAAHPGLERSEYAEQVESLLEASMGTSDAYVVHLRELGHDAVGLITNCEPLQLAWAREHGVATGSHLLGGVLPGRVSILLRRRLMQRIAAAQIAASDPDVLFVHEMSSIDATVLRDQKANGRILVTQIASPLPPPDVYRRFDLILSSFHHFVHGFRAQGIDSEYFRLGFYERVIDRLARRGVQIGPERQRPVAVSFIGGLDPRVHPGRTAFLERLAGRLPLEVWGYGADHLAPESPLLECYRGRLWGLDMYSALASSQITLNYHSEAAEGQANNMRLYEATGMGVLVLTESSANLEELFEPDAEVVSYADEDDLVNKVDHLLKDDPVRTRIASAGQRRTLSEHTYRDRMRELSAILEERLARRTAR